MAGRCECENEPSGFYKRLGITSLAEQMRGYALFLTVGKAE
jgi:hypothetical protein